MSRTEENFWLDAAIFGAVITTALTGLVLWLVPPHPMERIFPWFSRGMWEAVHIGSGGMGLAGVALHIVRHRGWLSAVRGRPLRGMPVKVRANRVVDRALWIAFIAANGSGAAAWALHLGEAASMVRVSDRLHAASGMAWAALLAVHLALHWKWIAAAARRCVQIRLRGFHAFPGRENSPAGVEK